MHVRIQIFDLKAVLVPKAKLSPCANENLFKRNSAGRGLGMRLAWDILSAYVKILCINVD